RAPCTTCASSATPRAGPTRSRWTCEPGRSALHHTQRHHLRHPATQATSLGRGHHLGDVFVRVRRLLGQPAPGRPATRDPLPLQVAAQVLLAHLAGRLVSAAHLTGSVTGGGVGRCRRHPHVLVRGGDHGTRHHHWLTHRFPVVRQVRV